MKNRTGLGLSAFLGVLAVTQMAAAANTGNDFVIGDITIQGGDTARIYALESTMGGTTPSCAGSRSRHFAINLATPKGRAMYDLALGAMLSGKRLSITGADNCNVLSGYQTLDVLTLWR